VHKFRYSPEGLPSLCLSRQAVIAAKADEKGRGVCVPQTVPALRLPSEAKFVAKG